MQIFLVNMVLCRPSPDSDGMPVQLNTRGSVNRRKEGKERGPATVRGHVKNVRCQSGFLEAETQCNGCMPLSIKRRFERI